MYQSRQPKIQNRKHDNFWHVMLYICEVPYNGMTNRTRIYSLELKHSHAMDFAFNNISNKVKQYGTKNTKH